MNLNNLMKTKINFKKINRTTKAVLNLNYLFAIIILVYWSFANKVNINVLATMVFFEIIYLIISSSIVVAEAYNK